MDKPPGIKDLNEAQVRQNVSSRTDKVLVIRRSLDCYNLGWFSLIPLLGIGPALLVIHWHRKVSLEAGGEWNPARKYLLTGTIAAFCGLFIWLGLGAILCLYLPQLLR